jgi:hypothetical protein
MLWAIITIRMRFLITIMLITLLADSFGQISGYDFTRKHLKGIKRITSTRTNYYERDSATYNSIYFVNELGDIVKSESYENDELRGWTRYEYYDNGLLKYEETHTPIFSYDKISKKEIGRIMDDSYSGKIFEYNGDLLAKKRFLTCYDGSKSYNYVVLYEYDKSGRLIKEVSVDGSIGLTGDFKPNSSVIDSMYYKDKTTTWTTTHLFKADSIISTDYDDNNEIQGYSFTKLDVTKKPVNILETDPQKNGIKAVTMAYNNRGDLIQERIEIIDIDKITYDMVAGDDYQLFYDDRSLPILGITKEKGKIISKEVIRYK